MNAAFALKSAEVKLDMFRWLTEYRRFIIHVAVVVIELNVLAYRSSAV